LKRFDVSLFSLLVTVKFPKFPIIPGKVGSPKALEEPLVTQERDYFQRPDALPVTQPTVIKHCKDTCDCVTTSAKEVMFSPVSVLLFVC